MSDVDMLIKDFERQSALRPSLMIKTGHQDTMDAESTEVSLIEGFAKLIIQPKVARIGTGSGSSDNSLDRDNEKNRRGFRPLAIRCRSILISLQSWPTHAVCHLSLMLSGNISSVQMNISERVCGLELDMRASSVYYFYTAEGERMFCERYKCSMYPDKMGIYWYFKVGDNPSYCLSQEISQAYHRREISIQDVYLHWKEI